MTIDSADDNWMLTNIDWMCKFVTQLPKCLNKVTHWAIEHTDNKRIFTSHHLITNEFLLSILFRNVSYISFGVSLIYNHQPFSVFIISQTVKSSLRIAFLIKENSCWCKMVSPTYNVAIQKSVHLASKPVGDVDSNSITAIHVKLKDVHSYKMALKV